MSEHLGHVEATRLSGEEQFHQRTGGLGFSVLDFWRWACSDLLSNATRGLLAEFIVARALDLQLNVRDEWDVCDLTLPSGARIEVKSSAYLQRWHQKRHSLPSFGIAARRAWDGKTGTMAKDPCRSAEVYVFCLLAHREKSSVDPLDVDQWRFFVLSCRELDRRAPTQGTVGISTLRRFGADETDYAGLKVAVARALDGPAP